MQKPEQAKMLENTQKKQGFLALSDVKFVINMGHRAVAIVAFDFDVPRLSKKARRQELPNTTLSFVTPVRFAFRRE